MAQNWEAVKNSPHTWVSCISQAGTYERVPQTVPQTVLVNRLPLPLLLTAPNPHPKPILLSVKDLALAVAKGTKPFIPSQ